MSNVVLHIWGQKVGSIYHYDNQFQTIAFILSTQDSFLVFTRLVFCTAFVHQEMHYVSNLARFNGFFRITSITVDFLDGNIWRSNHGASSIRHTESRVIVGWRPHARSSNTSTVMRIHF